MTQILDQYGRPHSNTTRQRAMRTIRAKYDAAQTTTDNSRHWANADLLSPQAANSETVRKTLRSRARYEAQQNNSYAKGICLTLANDCIGTGPRLQLKTPNKAANQQVEREFSRWSRAVGLARKLRTMRLAKVIDGEIFGLAIDNPRLPTEVQLDLRIIEGDQVATPGMMPLNENAVDGILFDKAGNPTEYHVLKYHPGETNIGINMPTNDYDHVPADQVIHLFREDRTGQRRGIPEITPALPLFAQLRRYTLAVIAAAETAATYAGIVYTDSPAIDEVDDVEALDAFELEMRALLTMPKGWKMAQMKAEQPATTYVEFVKAILCEIARCLNIPYNVAAGLSADYNYASGRLDHQTYFKSIRIEQHFFELMCLNRIFGWWLEEAMWLPGYLPTGLGPFSEWDYQWFWDGTEHVDPEKEANAQALRLENHTTTYAAEYAKEGKDWEVELRQKAAEQKLLKEIGLVEEPPALQPNVPGKTAQSTPARIAASAESEFLLSASDAWEITAAANGKPPQASILAYGGGLMHVPNVGPVVVDIAGLDLSAGQIPILVDHKNDLEGVVGQGMPEVRDGAVYVAGTIHEVNAASQQVLALHKSGFAFQASVGLTPLERVQVRAGKTVHVNGRAITAPSSGFLLVRRSKLREVSLTPAGCDSQTAVSIAASLQKDNPMNEDFRQWLEARGHKPDELAQDMQAMLQTTWEADVKLQADAKEKTEPKGWKMAQMKAKADQDNADDPAADPVAELRAAAVAETKRIAEIQKACGGEHAEIQATAIGEDWGIDKVNLEVLRASRPTGPAIHDGTPKTTNQVLEAAVRLAGAEREDPLVKEYGEQTIEAAGRYRSMGFHGLFDTCCRMEGRNYPGRMGGESDLINAAFSTVGLSGILGDSARKSMLAAYSAVDSVIPSIAKKLSVADFKTHTGYRLTGPSQMEQVGPGGEIKHMTVDEESFTYKADTYAKMFGITRTMLINDDLGAFTEIPRLIGRGASLALENVFWTLVLANTGSFFGSGNSNQTTDALDSDALGTALTKFRKLTDADGYPINIGPKYWLGPPELEITAAELFVSTNINTGGSSTTAKVPNRNIWAGKFQPIVTPYLSNDSYSGYSVTAWYLLADPSDTACFGVAYLNGTERPVIEDAPLASNILGQAWRGYFDFGVCQVDSRGGVKSTGAS